MTRTGWPSFRPAGGLLSDRRRHGHGRRAIDGSLGDRDAAFCVIGIRRRTQSLVQHLHSLLQGGLDG